MNTVLDWLYALERRGIKVGLEHTRSLLTVCGNPQDNYPTIHIAGTNGKGSTAALTAAILQAAGMRVGLYTSPHLVKFNERIRINGRLIEDEYILQFIERYQSDIDQIESTFFETTTALAFSYFADHRVDVAVIETGLGGRLDSTNIIRPEITVITPVSIDHTELLGRDVVSIAAEKAGIIKANTPLVLAEQDPSAMVVITRRAEELGAPVSIVKRESTASSFSLEHGTEFQWRGNKYRTGLIGAHQELNAKLALEATYIIDPHLPVENRRSGLLKARWAGRMQVLHKNPTIIYDVAHNAAGIAITLDNLDQLFQHKAIGILALKADKDIETIKPVLRDRLKKLYVTDSPEAGLMPARQLYRLLSDKGIECELKQPLALLLMDMVRTIPPDQHVLVFGSHYMATAVFSAFDFSFDTEVI